MRQFLTTVLVLTSACGTAPGAGTEGVGDRACRRLASLPTVEVVRTDAAGRTWSLTLVRPSSVRPEVGLGAVSVSGGWVARGAVVRSPPLTNSVLTSRVDAIAGSGSVVLDFAPAPSVDPEPRSATVAVTLDLGSNDLTPQRLEWQTSLLTVAPCD